MDLLHPEEPHAYLGSLGVEPQLQGRGVGSALVAEWVAGLDRDGLAGYLETDRADNVSFYGRFGFEVVGETEILGARIWRMGRRAAA